MAKLRKKSPGFTLIELMIVVVIISVLAAMAIPRFMRTTTRTKQREAQTILKQIYSMQRAYKQEYSSYWDPGGIAAYGSVDAGVGVNGRRGFAELKIELISTARYTYTINAGINNFTATATSGILDEDGALDIWTIDDKGNLVCLSDDSIL